MASARALAALLTLAIVALSGGTAAAKGKDHGGGHSLRAPLTGENFYFVMADRFENGRTDNDKGGIDSADPTVTGLDPTHKGMYHGGDLAGLLKRIDYIKGLGTTSIWLTPSFKNRAVPARGQVGRLPRLLDHGLHADRPAPRHQRRAAPAGRCRARARDEGLLRHHHQPHRGRHRLPRGLAPGVRLQGPRAVPHRVRHAVRRRRLRGHRALPRAQRRALVPVHPVRARRPAAQGAGVAQRHDALPQPRQHDVHRRELALRRLLRARRPVHRASARRVRDDRRL